MTGSNGAGGATRRARVGRSAAALVVVLAFGVAGCSSSTNDGSTAQPSSGGTTAGTTGGTTAPAPIRVLVSNDDGVAAPGIDTLVEGLRQEPGVTVVVSAPAENQSGTGGKTTPGTLVTKQTTTKSGYEATSVAGFPADSVTWYLESSGQPKPDVVISGINFGQNLGPAIDISGTVGAARAAATRGIPAVAVSQGLATPATDPLNYTAGLAVAIDWLRDHRAAIAAHQAPATVTNFNAPTCNPGSVRGLKQVPYAKDAAGRNIIGASDCTTPAPEPKDDLDAFLTGWATESEIPNTPATA